MDGGRDVGVKPRNVVVVFELLDRLLEVPDGFFSAEVLARLDPTDRAIFAQVGRPLYGCTVAQQLYEPTPRGLLPERNEWAELEWQA
jgi:hypothetical protein